MLFLLIIYKYIMYAHNICTFNKYIYIYIYRKVKSNISMMTSFIILKLFLYYCFHTPTNMCKNCRSKDIFLRKR